MRKSGVLYLLLPLALGYVFLCALPFSVTVQEKMMRKFHLNSSSRWEWCVLQLLPSMYNFSNTTHITLTENIEGETFWVNHYPMRLLTFYPMHEHTDLTAELRSRYRGAELRTIVKLRAGGGQLILQEQLAEFNSR